MVFLARTVREPRRLDLRLVSMGKRVPLVTVASPLRAGHVGQLGVAGQRVLVNRRLPRAYAELVLVGRGWLRVVSAEPPARSQ